MVIMCRHWGDMLLDDMGFSCMGAPWVPWDAMGLSCHGAP